MGTFTNIVGGMATLIYTPYRSWHGSDGQKLGFSYIEKSSYKLPINALLMHHYFQITRPTFTTHLVCSGILGTSSDNASQRYLRAWRMLGSHKLYIRTNSVYTSKDLIFGTPFGAQPSSRNKSGNRASRSKFRSLIDSSISQKVHQQQLACLSLGSWIDRCCRYHQV